MWPAPRRACVLATRRAGVHFHFHNSQPSVFYWQLRSWFWSTRHGLEPPPLLDKCNSFHSQPRVAEELLVLNTYTIGPLVCVHTAYSPLPTRASLCRQHHLDPPLFYSRTVDKQYPYTSPRRLPHDQSPPSLAHHFIGAWGQHTFHAAHDHVTQHGGEGLSQQEKEPRGVL